MKHTPGLDAAGLRLFAMIWAMVRCHGSQITSDWETGDLHTRKLLRYIVHIVEYTSATCRLTSEKESPGSTKSGIGSELLDESLDDKMTTEVQTPCLLGCLCASASVEITTTIRKEDLTKISASLRTDKRER